MNGLLSDVATIERIHAIESELALLRADAYVRAGIPLPTEIKRVGRIIELASVAFGFPVSLIVGETRCRRVARARFGIMWVAHAAYGTSSVDVGRALGNRDHSTVLHGLGRAAEIREQDEDFREVTDGLLATITPKKPAEEAENAPNSH